MNRKALLGAIGTSAAAIALGVAGFVNSVSAQAPIATPAPSTPSAQATPSQGAPLDGPAKGLPGGPHGRGDFGPGGFGGHHGPGGDMHGLGIGGPRGAEATVDGANAQISHATDVVNTAKGDLTYANGKMDTANVQKWLNNADALLKSAGSAVTSTQYEKASGYARAASELARVAEGQMAQALGADKLPSYSQRPQRPNRPDMGANPNANVTFTQAQASRVLAGVYNSLTAQGAIVKSSEATPYLTDARNAYKAAYSAYGAGKYNDALSSARLAQQLLGIANTVQAATTAPDKSDTPVTVPAPNF